MKQILIPTDFSKTSWNAARYVLQCFEKETATFQLLNTFTPDFVHTRILAVGQYRAEEDSMQIISEEGLTAFKDRLQQKIDKNVHQIQTISSFNLLPEEIREITQEEDIDLIVSGTTGATGLKEIFLGSNTVRILKASEHAPVLIVPEGSVFRVPLKFGFVTDFKRPFTPRQLELMHHFLKNFESELHIMHIGSESELTPLQRKVKEDLAKQFSYKDFEMHWFPSFASKAEMIQVFLRDRHIDLLAMIHYEHGFVDELIREPVVKKMAFHTQIPMLVIPEI